MNTLIYVLGIPLAVFFVARGLAKMYRLSGNTSLLVLACVLFALSLFIPSPLIHGENTEFFTHLLGGGVFVGFLWLYFRPLIKPKAWYIEPLQLLVLVSVLGVANELFELFMLETGITSEPLTDTSWDLLANTIGIVLFYAAYSATKYTKSLFLQR